MPGRGVWRVGSAARIYEPDGPAVPVAAVGRPAAASPLDRAAAVLAGALHGGHSDGVAAARGRETAAALRAGGYQAAAQRLLDWLGAHEEGAARFGRAAVWIMALIGE